MTSRRAFWIPTLVTLGVLLFGGGVASAATGPARLLKDINTTPSSNRGSFPNRYQRLGNIALFQALTPLAGIELWRTDGTEAGTFLVKDICPGLGASFAYPAVAPPDKPFVEVGGVMLFLANDGVHGFELWRSDGTGAGTLMVKEIRPGSSSAFLAPLLGSDRVLWQTIVAGGTMYFLANDGVHGFELWRTDGTESGTTLVQDLSPGPASAFGTNQFNMLLVGQEAGGSFFFRTSDGFNRAQLWKTDGTPAGTVLIHPGANVTAPDNFTELDGRLLFTAYNGDSGSGLWRSDGTAAGTVQFAAASPWPSQTYPFDLVRADGVVYFGTPDGSLYRTDGTSDGTVPVRRFASVESLLREWNGSLLFRADDGIHGRELWRSDGTAAGTFLVKDIVPGPVSSSTFISFTEAGDLLFFFSADGVHGGELWRTDGTEAGTFLAKDITPGPAGSDPYNLVGVEGNLFLYIADAERPNPLRLWRSDGTEAGTRAVQSPPAFGNGIALNGAFLFGANDVVHGSEVWKSDGTDAGTALVKDIHPSFATLTSNPQFMGALSIPGGGERMFLRADDGLHGSEPWLSDGTESGTRLLKDIRPGSPGSTPSPGFVHDGAIYFVAGDDDHGSELWRSDGTEAGTTMVADIRPGIGSGLQSNSLFAALGDSIYFAAEDGVNGRTLWKSDGTESGTLQVAGVDLTGSFASTGNTSLYPITIGGTIYFNASDPVHGIELWKSDGTEAGTVLVRDLWPGPAHGGASTFANLHGRLFMIVNDQEHGVEPWLSDGTEAGTSLIKDIFPGSTSSHRRLPRPVALGDSIYFPAKRDGIHGEGLWKTDGTEAGTFLVRDLRPGVASTFNDSPALFDGTLFFVAAVGTAPGNYELWKSDGTEEGTRVVKAGLGTTSGPLALDGGLVFASHDSERGSELWRSDGTVGGSVLVQDIIPGPVSSSPRAFTRIGTRVIFLAGDGFSGPEPWVARTAILLGRPDRAIEDLKGEMKLLRLPRGIETSLGAILDAAARDLSANRTVPAILSLEAFGRHLDALSPGKVSEDSAADLQEFASEIVGLLKDPVTRPRIPRSPSIPRAPIVEAR